MNILIINGPNLNLLGQREPEIYGHEGFDGFLESLKQEFSPAINLTYFQSNVEGEIINCIQESDSKVDAMVINAGGYTHTSVAIGDAIAAVNTPCMEVHISNVYARESYRHESKMAHRCVGVISGLGLNGYRLAISHFTRNEKDS